MTLIRLQHNKNNPYVQLNKSIVYDKSLSWKAKGIFLYAFSRPDDWQFYESELVNHSTDGKDSVRGGIKELEKAGYLKRERLRSEDGTYGDSIWYFYETPQQTANGKTQDGKPNAGKPRAENPNLDNPPLLNKEYTKNDYTKKDILTRAREAIFIHEPRQDSIEVRELVHLTKPELDKLEQWYSPEMLEVMYDKLNLQHEQILQGLSKRKKPYTISVFNKNSWLWEAANRFCATGTHKATQKADFKDWVKSNFTNGKTYNHAEYNADALACGFTRGMRHDQVRWDDYNFKERFTNMATAFGVLDAPEPDKPRPPTPVQGGHSGNDATALIAGLTQNMRYKHEND